jgi:hypothetical protein
LECVYEVFKNTGTIWENYAADAVAQGSPARRDFVGWSGIAPILYFLEYKIGLMPDAVNNTLTWELTASKRTGCKRYRFNGHLTDLVATPDANGKQWSLSIKSDGAFKLVVKTNGKERVFYICVGEQTHHLPADDR